MKAKRENSNQLFLFNVIIVICLAITYVLKLKSLLFFNVSIYIIMNIFVKNHKRLLYLTGFFTAWVFISPALYYIYYITQNTHNSSFQGNTLESSRKGTYTSLPPDQHPHQD